MMRQITPVVKILLILNIALFVLSYVYSKFTGGSLNGILGLHYWTSEKFQPFQIVTHFFMHSDQFIGHVFFNMFALFMFGPHLERKLGAERFLFYYFFTAIGAAVIFLTIFHLEIQTFEERVENFKNNPTIEQFESIKDKEIGSFYQQRLRLDEFINEWLKYPESNNYKSQAVSIVSSVLEREKDKPIVGASGAIFGILLAFGMFFPNLTLLLLIPPIPIKAKYLVLILGVFELYSGLRFDPSNNTANFAHLGGMLFGFILIKIWQKKGRLY
ncbi:MAG: rhomboid family intramembrane serine protease [Chitinophagales bacterium]|nr:rhomboid family intramembrane serine protease [Chitinophagales bacterium]